MAKDAMRRDSDSHSCEHSERIHRRYELLSRLPLLFTSGLDPQQARALALKHLRAELAVEAATLFLVEASKNSLRMWVVEGGADSLQSEQLPIDRGMVGWVIKNQATLCSEDVTKDPRFFADVDRQSGFHTRSMICVPLTTATNERIGALQVLNKVEGPFDQDDVELLECLAPLVVLGIEGALLRERTLQQQRHLEALKRKREDMLSVIAHEFRTPLGVIQATADLIVGGKLSSELQARSAARLSASVQRLTRLVSDIRTSQNLVSRPLEVMDERLLVTETCNQVIRELAAAAAQVRHISLVSDIPEGLAGRGDNALFAVAFRNIVHNAIRFTPDGGLVEVKGSPGLGTVVLEVQDTGLGIPPEEREAIFERFYEAGSAITHSSGDLQFKSGGLGLGLATAKAILDGHRASLEIESRPGGGSTFRIRLPVS